MHLINAEPKVCSPVQIAVCTPGRMIDLIKMKACTMRRATFLVFDEADRMFDMGFEPQVRRAPCERLRPLKPVEASVVHVDAYS